MNQFLWIEQRIISETFNRLTIVISSAICDQSKHMSPKRCIYVWSWNSIENNFHFSIMWIKALKPHLLSFPVFLIAFGGRFGRSRRIRPYGVLREHVHYSGGFDRRNYYWRKMLLLTRMSLTNRLRSEEESTALCIWFVHFETFWRRTQQFFAKARVVKSAFHCLLYDPPQYPHEQYMMCLKLAISLVELAQQGRDSMTFSTSCFSKNYVTQYSWVDFAFVSLSINMMIWWKLMLCFQDVVKCVNLVLVLVKTSCQVWKTGSLT